MEETGQAKRFQARAEKMARRQRSDKKCSMCGGFHYRDLGPEWTHPCKLCHIRHGGYCAPAHGLTPEDWG